MSITNDPARPVGVWGRAAAVRRAAHQPATRPEPGINRGALVVGLAVAVVFGWGDAQVGGPVLAGASVLGSALGFALFHSRFGFSSAWRQVVAVGQAATLRAHMLMLAVASVLFAVLLANRWGWHGAPSGLVQPVGIALIVGSFLFGVGMQVGGSCSSGTLFAVGSGQTAILGTVVGFIVGSVLAAASYAFWFVTLPAGPSISLARLWGYPLALVISLAVMALIVTGSYLLADRRRPPPVQDPPTSRGLIRMVRGSWPLWAGALVLALLNAAVLFVTGKPWGVTTAFGLWAPKPCTLSGCRSRNGGSGGFPPTPPGCTILCWPIESPFSTSAS